MTPHTVQERVAIVETRVEDLSQKVDANFALLVSQMQMQNTGLMLHLDAVRSELHWIRSIFMAMLFLVTSAAVGGYFVL
jgi:rhamnogalacturonyl hydrolase YesR